MDQGGDSQAESGAPAPFVSEAAARLDRLLDTAIAEFRQPRKRPQMKSKLDTLLSEFRDGTKEIEARADEILPRFRAARRNVNSNLDRMQAHSAAAEEALKQMEDWNNQVAGGNGGPSLDDSKS